MRRRMVFAGAILTFALFSISPAPGEQAPTAGANAPEITSQEAPVTFSSKVNLVQVPVVVRDARGRVVLFCSPGCLDTWVNRPKVSQVADDDGSIVR